MKKKNGKGWLIAGIAVLSLALAGATAYNFQPVRDLVSDITDGTTPPSSEAPASSEASV